MRIKIRFVQKVANLLTIYVLGPKGNNVGVELDSVTHNLAKKNSNELQLCYNSTQWCKPKFKCLNVFEFDINQKFDRIFVEAKLDEVHRTFICQFLNLFGFAIVPMKDGELQKVTKVGDDQFIIQNFEYSRSFENIVEIDGNEMVEDPYCK